MNIDFLKPVLGDELFAQVQERLAAATGITLANIADGSYFPKSKFDDVNGNLATTLINGIVNGCADLVPDLSELLSAIGRGIAAAGKGLGEAASQIIAKLVEFTITPENWAALMRLGETIVRGIEKGIIELGAGILDGAWEVVKGTLKGLFKGLGFEFREWSEETEAALNSAVTMVNSCGEEVVASLEDAITAMTSIDLAGGMNSENLANAMQAWNLILTRGTDELIKEYDEYSFLACKEITDLFAILCNTMETETNRAAAMIACRHGK